MPGAGQDPAIYSLPRWTKAAPNLVHGITAGADMSLFGSSPAGQVMPRWLRLHHALGCTGVVHAQQVHRAEVLVHSDVVHGVLVAGSADGHATSRTGLLLAVSVADCVPIFVADTRRSAVAMLHAGWRGAAAGILEQGIATMQRSFGSRAEDLMVHLGPAICGACFEVGAEVPPAIGLETVAAERVFVDLRNVLAARAVALGVPAHRVTVSAFCTRCGDSPFFSHRAGCAERQLALLALKPSD